MFENKQQEDKEEGSFLKRKDFKEALSELQEISNKARQVYEEEKNGDSRMQKED